MNDDFADLVARLCLEKFDSLPCKGKPIACREWTLLSGVVQTSLEDSVVRSKVVSLATGTKCIGASKLCGKGTVINDSHAEVLARRALLRYLLGEIQSALTNGRPSIFVPTVPAAQCRRDDPATTDTRPDTTGKVDTRPDTTGKVDTRPDTSGTTDTRPDTPGTTDDLPDGSTTTDDLPDVPGTTDDRPDVLGTTDDRPDVLGTTDDLPDGSSTNDDHPGDRTSLPWLKSDGRPPDGTPLTLRPDVAFHFFCSHTPCGDASIFPKGVAAAADGQVPDGGPDAKKRKLDDDDDIHRTGAKCLGDETRQDPRLPGAAYHAVGAVRTKPGRGDRTLSVSCSDKLLRWHWSGVQGALLSLMVGPVRLSSLTVGGGCAYSESALRRAVIDRASTGHGDLPFPLRLMRSGLEFEHAKHRLAAVGCKPCPSSVVWWDGDGDGCHEVLVNGRKQGVTKKTMDRPSGASALCKKSLLDAFKRLRRDGCDVTYAQIKREATSYRHQWTAIKSRLGCWTDKPESLLEFT